MSAFLKNKWIGIIAILLYSLIAAFSLSGVVQPAIEKISPAITEVSKSFLPINIRNGEITGEERFVKEVIDLSEENDAENNGTLNIVLDTRVDAFNVSDLKEIGIYFSKKNFYVVKGNETVVRPLSSLGNADIDEQTVQEFNAYLAKISSYIPAIFFIVFVIYMLICVALYSLITYLIMLMFAKCGFSRIYAVNGVVLSVIGIIKLFANVNIGIIATLVVLLCVNYLYKKTQEAE